MIAFNEKYSKESFLTFLEDFLPEDFIIKEKDVSEITGCKIINSVKELGYCESLNLTVLEANHNKNTDPRVGITADAFNLLRKYDLQKALVVFNNNDSENWRLSYLAINLDVDEKSRITRKYSSPRRFSFYLGVDAKTKTAKQQLMSEGRVKNASDLLERFSVTNVTNQFFEEYKKLFIKIVAHLDNDQEFLSFTKSKNVDIHDVAKKLLGQIAFIYFLQKKRWLGAGKEERIDEGDPKFLRNLFKKYKVVLASNEPSSEFNFFNDYLEYLFYEALNIESEYSTNSYRDRFDAQIPFLNGGLFQPIADYPWRNKFLQIPDEIFSNDQETGILDIFDQYNFTVDENHPNDQEVSVDPEMLGKVFERLLDTRKTTGSFYTPREIVSYMVRESLMSYLKNESGVEDNIIIQLVNTHSLPDNLSQAKDLKSINECLQRIKILDPAVGSGAFPVGLLQEMSAIRTFCENGYKEKPKSIYEIKNEILENNLYGSDIDTGAIEIARLRFWLSLVVDTNVSEIKPLPNLEFKLIAANSLVQPKKAHKTNSLLDDSELLEKIQGLREKFFRARTSESKKRIRDDFESLIIRSDHLFASEEQKRISSYHPFDQSKASAFFDPKFMFGIENFDLVIGNPPYGGEKIDDELKNQMELGSKDMYGAFISRSINSDNSFIKPDGILSFIVSDTFMTLKTHRQLREQILQQRVDRIIRLNSDTFKATVNTSILFLHKSEAPENHVCEMADLTNVSVHENYSEFVRVLSETRKDDEKNISTDKYAIYYYPQSLVKTNSNKPFFVGSPKLFTLLNDSTVEKNKQTVANQEVDVRNFHFNNKSIKLVRFGDIAEVMQGLATGDNNHYLFQNPKARGNYRSINDFKDYLLSDDDLQTIYNNEELRLKIIKRGFHKSKTEADFDDDLWFGGKYIVPYDKGGESDSGTGWLPNYYVPTNYYIDWSQESLLRMKTITIKERNKLYGKAGGSNSLCAVIRNSESYFLNGVTYSRTGVYAPSFRRNSVSAYDTEGSTIISILPSEALLGLLSSKLSKFFLKTYIGHTVHTQVDELKELPIFTNEAKLSVVSTLVESIIEKQRKNLRYDYMSNEQTKIDRLIYEAYGLSDDDIQEVEKWYARRYPKLRKWCYIRK